MISMIRDLFILAITFISCTSNRHVGSGIHQKEVNKQSMFKVYRIDSVNSYYLIYAQRKDSLFKIVSKKAGCVEKKLINTDAYYPFLLKSIWNTPIAIEGVNASPSSVYNVNCINFDDSTKICLERDSISDLYIASNIQGLCFVE